MTKVNSSFNSRFSGQIDAPLMCAFAVALIPLFFSGCGNQSTEAISESADVLIHGGTVYDGGRNPGRGEDVAIADGRILAVGPDLDKRYKAKTLIDASGKIVAPGFIDAHTHPDTYVRSDDASQRMNAPWLFQGVTTLMTGVDGGGSPDIAAQRTWFEKNGVGTNLAPYVGFGAVRRAVLGDDARAPNTDELERMKSLVANAMCEGAFGLSAGLFYAPQSFAKTDEVVELAREAAKRGGIYDTHQRDESSYSIGVMESTREAISIGRKAGLPVHFAHLKVLGIDVQGRANELIGIIDQARKEGLNVTADQYPWLASGSSLEASLLPRWSVDGGRVALLKRLDDASTLDKIKVEMRENLRRRGGAKSLLLTASGQEWTGKTLEDMANEWKVDPIDAALKIIRTNNGPEKVSGMTSVASFNMAEPDVELIMQQPWVVTSSDGSDGHPRQYATFPEKYLKYVKQRKTIDMASFIHRSTGATADMLGIEQRGYLKPGYWADVVVFDPKKYAPRADYLHPRELSAGVDQLLVNGKFAIRDRKMTDIAAGRMLSHAPTAGTCP